MPPPAGANTPTKPFLTHHALSELVAGDGKGDDAGHKARPDLPAHLHRARHIASGRCRRSCRSCCICGGGSGAAGEWFCCSTCRSSRGKYGRDCGGADDWPPSRRRRRRCRQRCSTALSGPVSHRRLHAVVSSHDPRAAGCARSSAADRRERALGATWRVTCVCRRKGLQ